MSRLKTTFDRSDIFYEGDQAYIITHGSGRPRKRKVYMFNCRNCGKRHGTTTAKSIYCSDHCSFEFRRKIQKNKLQEGHIRDNSMPDSVVALKTGTGYIFKVNNRDLMSILKFNWHKDGYGYLCTTVNDGKKRYSLKLHRYIMNVSNPDILVDHIDGDMANNDYSNLRLADKSLNAINDNNRKKESKLGVRNIYESHTGKYGYRFKVDGVLYIKEGFETIKEAVFAKDKARSAAVAKKERDVKGGNG